MNICYNEATRTFWLETPLSTYCMGIMDHEDWLVHLYYGEKIGRDDVRYLARIGETAIPPSACDGERLKFLDSLPQEYPTAGVGDYRSACLKVRTRGGHSACSLSYVSHKIFSGKKSLPGLPATFGSEEECMSLEILCRDTTLDLDVILSYTVFKDLDVIARSARLRNRGMEELYLTCVLSACLDMDAEDYDLITLNGVWARERMINRRRIVPGHQSVSSLRGESSHQANPFLAVLDGNADQDSGRIWGMNLVYSGNFLAETELSQRDLLRAVIGICPEDFCWKLEPQEEFIAPEAVLVFSNCGLGGMSRTFHDLYRRHLIRGKYAKGRRPVLINNWEATYFDFDAEKILSIAKEASRQGIEMLVLDDGWFGSRSDDCRALGDWTVNEEKLPGGLKYLADEINRLGMKFGLWFEPEMISPDSDLYRAHPDWAIRIPGRAPSQSRHQLVLDFSRQEVVEAVYAQIQAVLRSANIAYVKWDMNRNLTDMGSFALESDRQGELAHRYMLGVYAMQERLLTDFPNLLLENCSAGGGRFDAGMLYYSPQIWCSDDTDAVERLSIQEGTALVYPVSTMGTHVSVCPCHSSGRSTPLDTRAYVALTGTFGYELDITKLSEKELGAIREQVKLYHRYELLVREGDYYRLASYRENREYDACMIVSKDKQEALVVFIQVYGRPMGSRGYRIHLKGLDETRQYLLEEEEAKMGMDSAERFQDGVPTANGNIECYSGATLMHAGILTRRMWGDYRGRVFHLRGI